MSASSRLTIGSPISPPEDYTHSPREILTFLVILIYLAEFLTMCILYFVPISNYWITSILDGFLMLVMILPGLYSLQLKPLMKEMEERAQAEAALRSSEELLEKVLELLPVGVVITDRDGQIIHGNPTSQKIWGEIRYVGMERYPEYKARWVDSGRQVATEEWAGARAILRGVSTLDQELEIETFEGSKKFILNSAVPLLDDNKDIQGAIVVNQDITRRIEQERALLQTNELLEKVFFSIDTLIAYLDRDFNFLRVNETYARSGGHPAEFYIGKNHFDLFPNEENRQIFQRVVETGEPFSVFEKAFVYADQPELGITYWDWSLQPVKKPDNQVEGLVLSLVDVTQRKRAELQLERQNQELRQISESERQQRELAESLVQSMMVLNTHLDLDKVLSSILDLIRKAIPYHGASIILIEDRTMKVAGYRGFESHFGPEQAGFGLKDQDLHPYIYRVAASLQPVLIPCTQEDPEWGAKAGLGWVQSWAAVPLAVGKNLLGVISLFSETPGAFTPATINQLVAFAAPAALTLHNAQLYDAEKAARKVSETLSDAALALTDKLDLEHVIHTLLDHVQAIVHADTAGLTLLEDEKRLVLRELRGYPENKQDEQIPCLPMDGITDSILERLKLSRKSIVIPNLNQPQQPPGRGSQQLWCWLVVPILAADKFIGLVELGRIQDEPFSPEHIHWAEALCGQAAVAVQNAWLFEQVRSSSERLHSLAHKLVEIQENERYHVARELHDEAGQTLSSLKLGLGRLEHEPGCPEHVQARLAELQNIADRVLEELHRLAMDLRPVALDRLGLDAALEQFARNLPVSGLSIQFKAVGFERERLPQDLETSLYRIVQEALTNVIRHAGASNVGILLEWTENRVRVYIEDDGVGFLPESVINAGRLGLLGMRERAEMFGGSIIIESAPGKGTTIVVEVPCGNQDFDCR